MDKLKLFPTFLLIVAGLLTIPNQSQAINLGPINSGKSVSSYNQGGGEIKVEKQELKRFVKAHQAIQKIRENNKNELIRIVEGNGFTINRYRKIVKNQISAAKGGQMEKLDKGDNINVSDSELKLYKKVKRQVNAVQKRINQQINQAVKKQNFEYDRYRKIAFALQENEALKQKFKSLR